MTRVFAYAAVVLTSLIAQAGSKPGIGRLEISPRLQWEANGGYCGEVSMISAGLYFGQYMSQYNARICAIRGVPQDKGELLLGSNDRRAARRMRLRSVEWTSERLDPQRFLHWVQRHVRSGHPVIIGVYNNERRLYGRTDPQSGDPQYDHIVPVLSAGRGRLAFSDNGLWGTGPDKQGPRRRFVYHENFQRFPGTREQANRPNGPIYTLPNDSRNFGVAILGIIDNDGEALPIRIRTNLNYEWPAMARRSNRRPLPMALELQVTVSGLQPGREYRLYRYNHINKVPTGRFNASASSASQSWNIIISEGSTFTLTQNILSDEEVIYRCVPATAP